MRWRLITINTKHSWPHGSPRGFRSRGHRIHSSGDYRNPPPAGEHAGLLRYRQEQTGAAQKIRIRRVLRAEVGRALVECYRACGQRLLALSVSSDHSHAVIELPDQVGLIKSIVGDAKRRASRAVKNELPGAVWSAGCDYEPIDTVKRLRREVNYVLMKQGEGTWTWSFRDGEMWCEERVQRTKQGVRAG
jgi:REP element-mobilizing transposase RayT